MLYLLGQATGDFWCYAGCTLYLAFSQQAEVRTQPAHQRAERSRNGGNHQEWSGADDYFRFSRSRYNEVRHALRGRWKSYRRRTNFRIIPPPPGQNRYILMYFFVLNTNINIKITIIAPFKSYKQINCLKNCATFIFGVMKKYFK